jgi:serine/threonine-protein kinase
MAPEQLAGKEVTERSDIYALGLVLYELFTGTRVFDGKSLAELTRMHLDQEPVKPTALVPDLDPAIERVILRCLEKNPEARPQSPLSVAAALPGGDPLAAALAAGETPSPELVAAAGEQGELRPRVAVAALVFSVIGMLLAVALYMGMQLTHLVPLEKTPPALEDRSREILKEVGLEGPFGDEAVGLVADADYLKHVAATDSTLDRWSHLSSGRPPAMQFWYRGSPQALVSSSFSGLVSPSDPDIRVSGMAGVNLDMQGRLVELYAVPPQVEEVIQSESSPDWTELLVRAGLDETRLTPIEPKWTPPFFCDERAAWEGVYPDAPAIPIRVEAAAYQGRPVYFRVIHEWTRPERMERFQASAQQAAANQIGSFLIVATLVAAALLARRNLRLGRGDRLGAFRLAAYTLSANVIVWFLQAHHVVSFGGELVLFGRGAGSALLQSSFLWMMYIALEPYVRRRWPNALISWNRLLGGGFRDPLVGQHVLVGAVAGVAFTLVVFFCARLPGWMGQPLSEPDSLHLGMLLGVRQLAATILAQQVNAVALSLAFLLLLLLFRVLLRKEVLAGLVLSLILGTQMTLGGEMSFLVALPLFTLAWSIPVFVSIRFGLLALVSSTFTLALLVNHPLTLDFTHWTGSASAFILLVLAGMVFYGFRVSLGRQPLLRDDVLHG